jgi:ABC-2 type transport system permease protein
MNNYTWLIRREFWERRAIWIVPACISGALILVALFGRVQILADVPHDSSLLVGKVYLGVTGALFITIMTLYSTLYLLDCLYDDRRDRSVLFWKSLPISDTDTVLSKLIVGLLAIPLVSFVAADITSLIVAFIVSVRAPSMIGGSLWEGGDWLQMQVLWLYVIFTMAIWYLPVAGWCLMVSAWVKRAPMLWSILPLLVAYLIERFFLGTDYIGQLIGGRLAGYARAAFHPASHGSNGSWNAQDAADAAWHLMDIRGFFGTSATWIGLAVGAAMVAAAIQMRMRRAEM